MGNTTRMGQNPMVVHGFAMLCALQWFIPSKVLQSGGTIRGVLLWLQAAVCFHGVAALGQVVGDRIGALGCENVKTPDIFLSCLSFLPAFLVTIFLSSDALQNALLGGLGPRWHFKMQCI